MESALAKKTRAHVFVGRQVGAAKNVIRNTWGILKQSAKPILDRVARMKTPLMLFGVAVSCGFPIGIVGKFVAKYSRTTQSKRKPLAVGRVASGRSIADQHDAIAIRVFHPVVARIKTR